MPARCWIVPESRTSKVSSAGTSRSPPHSLDGLPITAYRGDASWRKALDDARRVQVELLIEFGRLSARAAVS